MQLQSDFRPCSGFEVKLQIRTLFMKDTLVVFLHGNSLPLSNVEIIYTVLKQYSLTYISFVDCAVCTVYVYLALILMHIPVNLVRSLGTLSPVMAPQIFFSLFCIGQMTVMPRFLRC